MDILGVIFISVCLIPVYRYRKKISFYFCPDEVLGFNKRSVYLVLYCFFPAFIIVGFIVSYLRELLAKIDFLKDYENIALVFGLGLLILLLTIFGLISEKIVYNTDSSYRKWKDNKTTTNNGYSK